MENKSHMSKAADKLFQSDECQVSLATDVNTATSEDNNCSGHAKNGYVKLATVQYLFKLILFIFYIPVLTLNIAATLTVEITPTDKRPGEAGSCCAAPSFKSLPISNSS